MCALHLLLHLLLLPPMGVSEAKLALALPRTLSPKADGCARRWPCQPDVLSSHPGRFAVAGDARVLGCRPGLIGGSIHFVHRFSLVARAASALLFWRDVTIAQGYPGGVAECPCLGFVLFALQLARSLICKGGYDDRNETASGGFGDAAGHGR
jgi:hypothetical protein